MSGATDILIKKLADTINSSPAKKVSPYDTQAEVRRVEGDIAWVHIPGGVDETPVQLTTNAKKGDIVQVRVSGGNAWLYGNQTAPPTDDTKAIIAEKKAVVADEHATNAITSASIAQEAAESAQSSASAASSAAARAEGKADDAAAAATRAWNKAGEAETYAQEAETHAQEAQASADDAQSSATNAYSSATQALNQLSVVEDVVGVLDLIANNGDYQQNTDLEVIPDKWYFERTGTAPNYEYSVVTSPSFTYFLTSDIAIDPNKVYYTRAGSGTEEDPYVYSIVETPVVADIGTYYENTNQNYYVLVGIDQAIQNYVSSHLTLSGNSLFLQNGDTRVELSTTDGMILYNETGAQVAKYGTETIIGNINNFGIKIGESLESTPQNPVYELGFYQNGNRVAYINNNSLYITQTVVLRQMQMGDRLGVWAWCIHEVNSQNNLYLKWLG